MLIAETIGAVERATLLNKVAYFNVALENILNTINSKTKTHVMVLGYCT